MGASGNRSSKNESNSNQEWGYPFVQNGAFEGGRWPTLGITPVLTHLRPSSLDLAGFRSKIYDV